MIIKYLKIFFGILLFSFLLIKFDFNSVLNVIKLSDAVYIFIGFFLFFISGIFEVYKFSALLPSRYNFFEVFKIVYSGLFFNNFMPTNIGGDAYRILKLSKKNSYRKSSIIVIIDRLNGLALISLISLFALYFRPIDLTLLNIDLNYNSSFIAVITILLLIFLVKFLMSKYAKEVLNDIKLISAPKYAASVMYSMLFHIFRIVGIYYFVLAVGSDMNIIDIPVVLSIVLLISIIPISIGALGVREAAFVGGFSLYLVEPVSGLAIAILTRVFLFIQAIVGCFTFSQDG